MIPQISLMPWCVMLLIACSISCFGLAATTAHDDTSPKISLPGCHDRCGNVGVPFPFGIDHPNCARDPSFLLTCDRSMSPATLFPATNVYSFLSLSLEESTGIISVKNSQHCILGNSDNPIVRTRQENVNLNSSYTYEINLRDEPFTFSYTKNKFTVFGSGILAFMMDPNNSKFTSGCASLSGDTATNGSCSGIGCCQSTFPKGLKAFTVGLSSASTSATEPAGNGAQICGFVFLTDQDSVTDIIPGGNLTHYITGDVVITSHTFESHVVIDWVIDNNHTCAEALAAGYDNHTGATKYACGPNSKCYDSQNGPGYVCSCQDGFYGNPYLPQGCRDIEECKDPEKYPCHGTCTNVPGNYTCRCPLGMHGDGKVACQRTQLVALVAGISISFGFMILVAMLYVLRRCVKKKKREGLKKKYFAKNGGLLLKQQISLKNGKLDKTRIFTLEELEKATDFYNESRILGKGGQGTVYKGMLSDGTIVAIKKPGRMEEGQTQEFVNEMVILSQINHKHVVKLLGCCLETQVPLLVYEYISNGTLFSHIHHPKENLPLQWTDRLRIANAVAKALAYMHSAISTPIYHRDIKSSNILLDEKLGAKISDFGISRYVPLEKTHLTTLVRGTFGYLDPEYFRSSQFTDKSDVYSYGVVLVELLMGQKPFSTTVIEEEMGLAAQFLSAMEENHLFDVLDPQVMKEAKSEELLIFANVAKSCLELTGRNRPTMSEVAMVLENLQKMGKETLPMKRFQNDSSFLETSSERDDSSQENSSFLEASNRRCDSPIDTTSMGIVEDNEMAMVVLNISSEYGHNTM